MAETGVLKVAAHAASETPFPISLVPTLAFLPLPPALGLSMSLSNCAFHTMQPALKQTL